MKTLITLLLALLGIAASTTDAAAQLHQVSVAPLSFSFPYADPDGPRTVSSPQLTITYKIAGNPANGWNLTIQATDLISKDNDHIPATNITWVASPAPPFVATGTLSNAPQTLASEPGKHAAGSQTAYITFSLLSNVWTYKAGDYTQTITFTVSSL